MKKNTKIIVSAIIAVAVLLCGIVAVIIISDDKGEVKTEIMVGAETEAQKETVEEYELDGTPQKFESEYFTESELISEHLNVEIKSAVKTETRNEEPAVIITYVYTNASNYASSFWENCNHYVYQNGVSLKTTSSVANDYQLKGDDNAEVKTGSSTEIEIAYILNDTSSDLEVEVVGPKLSNLYTFSRTFTMK